jgi:hypothetical protein
MEARRASRANQECRCPKCGKDMVRLHFKIRIPKKDRKKWDEFKDWLTTTYVYYKGLI